MSEEQLLKTKKINQKLYTFIKNYSGTTYEKTFALLGNEDGKVDETLLNQLKILGLRTSLNLILQLI
jgi:hypothetical protein